MEKKRIIGIVIILFLVFNIVAFVIPSDMTPPFWVAYAFSIIAFLLELYMWLSFFKGKNRLMSQFYRIPVVLIFNLYAIVQGIIFLFFKFQPHTSVWISIIANVIVLAVALIGCITLDGTGKYVEEIDEKVRNKITNIKENQVEVEILLESVIDENVKKALGDLLEVIKYSDPMSHPSLVELEEQISTNIKSIGQKDCELQISVIDDTIRMIKERNKKCMILK